jgi:D-glycero-D-manno-heptose 1,7-bisphosphate phosphatase
MKRAIFIDRDGTLNRMVYDSTHGLLDSPRRPEQVELMHGAVAFLEGVRAQNYAVIMVTNQPGISKGTLSFADLDSVHAQLAALLAPEGWDDLRFCPHHPEFGSVCECRKPKPGMILEAAAAHGIDLGQSWMVGDGLVDVQAGRAAGCKTVLVTKLKVSVLEAFFELDGAEPDFVAKDLPEALQAISGHFSFKKVSE